MKNLKEFILYEIILYIIFCLVVNILDKIGHLDFLSLLCGILILPFNNPIFDFISRKVFKK